MTSSVKKEKELMDLMEAVFQQYAGTKHTAATDMCRKPEMRIVYILGRKERSIMSEIADQAGLSLSTVTGIIDSLLIKGLVQRERSEEDRRIVWVALTQDGWKIFRDAIDVRVSIVRGMLGALSRAEQDALIQLFRKIVHRIEREKSKVV